MKTNIVIGIDGSVPSRAALEWGVERALATGENVEILNAVDSHPDHTDSFKAKTLADIENVLASATGYAASRGIPVTTKLVDGEPFDELVRASRSADILVVGTHKTGFIQGRSIGSRFMALSAMSRCPVAFIPNVSLLSRRGVSIVLDDSSTGRRAAILAAAEAERLSQKLTMIHGEQWQADEHESARERTTRQLTIADKSRTLMALQLVTLADGHPLLETKTTATRKSLAIAAIDASMTAALVVVSHPQARASVGSSAGQFIHDVVLNLGGPVLVVPRTDADDAPSAV
ncbi:universal stress protein [Conyzicola sp.]|uniref:universal stress protein n=1 Tax=Conyzicola sp. TaxID=1969404 RepID=UPI003988C3B0